MSTITIKIYVGNDFHASYQPQDHLCSVVMNEISLRTLKDLSSCTCRHLQLYSVQTEELTANRDELMWLFLNANDSLTTRGSICTFITQMDNNYPAGK